MSRFIVFHSSIDYIVFYNYYDFWHWYRYICVLHLNNLNCIWPHERKILKAIIQNSKRTKKSKESKIPFNLGCILLLLTYNICFYVMGKSRLTWSKNVLRNFSIMSYITSISLERWKRKFRCEVNLTKVLYLYNAIDKMLPCYK